MPFLQLKCFLPTVPTSLKIIWFLISFATSFDIYLGFIGIYNSSILIFLESTPNIFINLSLSISKNNTTGASSDGVYTTKNASLEKVSNGYTYTAEYYYYIMQLTGEMKFGVYKNAFKEETYCETSLVDLYLTNNKLPEGCQNGVNYPKIRYNFDKNYRFINSEIL